MNEAERTGDWKVRCFSVSVLSLSIPLMGDEPTSYNISAIASAYRTTSSKSRSTLVRIARTGLASSSCGLVSSPCHLALMPQRFVASTSKVPWAYTSCASNLECSSPSRAIWTHSKRCDPNYCHSADRLIKCLLPEGEDGDEKKKKAKRPDVSSRNSTGPRMQLVRADAPFRRETS